MLPSLWSFAIAQANDFYIRSPQSFTEQHIPFYKDFQLEKSYKRLLPFELHVKIHVVVETHEYSDDFCKPGLILASAQTLLSHSFIFFDS